MSRWLIRDIEEITRRVAVEAMLTGGAANGGLWPQIVARAGLLRTPVVEESPLSEPPCAVSAPASGTASRRRLRCSVLRSDRCSPSKSASQLSGLTE